MKIFAEKGFVFSVDHCRKDHFAGTIIYYYEITQTTSGG
jgi:hypothetical protein